jgi:hypothetical protein
MQPDFVLPKFLRCVWANDRARATWQPRLVRISSAWREIEWLTVAQRVRPCVRLSIEAGEWNDWQRRSSRLGLVIIPLEVQKSETTAGAVLTMQAVVGTGKEAKRFARAWAQGDPAQTGAMLGYPECCCRAFVEAARGGQHREMLWDVAARSYAVNTERRVDIQGATQMNLFWRHLGVRALPHIPCRFDCVASLGLAREFANVGQDSGCADEVGWTSLMLSWPLEWSMLHGIAEMKTPVLKAISNVATLPGKFTLRWLGQGYPEEGAQGVTFPFRQYVSTSARRFVDGLNILYPAQ